jgi:cytoskeletal protein RodZ
MGAFGDKFRKAREKKDISLDDVSNVTKISSRMLQAIEQERFDQLPGGVFNKGFIRAYAKHLGLNDEEAVTDYLACLRQAQIDAHEVWQPDPPAPPRPAAPEKSRGATPNRPDLKKSEPKKLAPNQPVLNKAAAKAHPPAPVEELPDLQLPRAEDVRPRRKDFGQSSTPAIPWRIIALTAVVIVLGIFLWTRHSHGTNTAAASAPAKVAQTAPVPVSITATTPAATTPTARNSAAKISVAKTPPPTNSQPATAVPTHPASPALVSPLAANAGNADKNQIAQNEDDKNDVIVRTFPKSNPASPEKSAATLTLVIRADETSWIAVTADGQPVSHETLIAPAHASVRATREIVARIGNAAGVTFLWNGQEIPADGAEAEVKTFVFDSAGMRVIPSTPPSTH